jgi:hypothetical protein
MPNRRSPASAVVIPALVLALGLAACATPSTDPSMVAPPPPEATKPAAPTADASGGLADLPDGRLVRVDRASLSVDGLTVTMQFVGARPFDATDPCSRAYAGFAAPAGDVLEIAVVEAAHPMAPAEGAACDAMGHARVAEATLAEPFTGSTIRDLAGGVIFVGAPEGSARLGGLPDGWSLASQGDVPGGSVGRWRQTFTAPDSAATVGGQPGAIDFFQSFDGPIEVSGGNDQSTVEVGGQPAILYRNPAVGELVLTWSLGDDGFALVANVVDLDPEGLIALAETVTFD